MGFHKIAPYYYTGWHEPASELQFLINKQKFESLPGDLQQILKTAMRSVAYDMYIQSYHESAKNWATIQTDYPNVKIKTFPESVIKALKQANSVLLAERAARDPLAKEIIDSQQSYMSSVRVWTKMSDQSYFNTVNH